MEHKVGGVIAVVVFAVVGVFLWFNWRGSEPPSVRPEVVRPSEPQPSAAPGVPASMAGIERFIDRAERNGMQITAVWLPPIQMEGKDLPQDANVIHLEADIVALEGNVNGFSAGAWIPYLRVRYEITPADAGQQPITGEFLPMVAKDGPHYGATIAMPGPGKFRLTYKIEPPSVNGFGRHSDPITGVEPWWDPFELEFAFDYPGPATDAASATPK